MSCSITHAPPKDAEGCVEPHDHDQIYAADIMLRGIPERWIIRTDDGGHRISTGAFQASSDKYKGMSLAAKKVLECEEKDINEWAAGKFVAVVCFPVVKLRDVEILVGWDPNKDDPAHCNAWGKLRKSLQKEFAKKAKRRFLNS